MTEGLCVALATVAFGKDVDLHVFAAPDVPEWLGADPVRLRQVLSNLIGNAIKFTPEGGSVRVSVTQEDGKPIVRVRDNGIGVEPAERDKIFQRFYRTASGHRVPGRGLGLSIAAALANLHDFELRFDDNNPGAVFEMAGRRK